MRTARSTVVAFLLLLERSVFVQVHCLEEHSYDVNNPEHDHSAAAIAFDEEGDMQKAVASFRAAAKFNPAEPANWRNLAVALQDIDEKEAEKATQRAADAVAEQIERAREIGVDVKLADEIRCAPGVFACCFPQNTILLP